MDKRDWAGIRALTKNWIRFYNSRKYKKSRESAEAGESTTVTEAETTTAETQFRDSTTQNPTAQKDDVIPTGGFVAESSEAAKEDNKSKLPSTQAEIKNKN